MKRLLKRNNVIWIITPLVALPLVFGACTGAPAANAATVNDGAQARDAIIDYLDGRYSSNLPGQDVLWNEEDLTPPGTVGSSTKSYQSDGWTLFISYPIVKPDQTVYDVRLISNDSGWKWEGSVSADGTVSETSPLKQITEDESRQIAEDFVKNSPTFIFDGLDGTLKLVDTVVLRTPFGWTYKYAFQSAHGGYGNRTGQQVLQAITPHTVEISIILGEVINATMDGQWDMVNQKMNVDIPVEPGREVAESFIRNSPTFEFDGMDGSMEWVETLYLTPDNSRALVFVRFQSTHSGYGDRTGQILAEVITRHDVQITIDRGEVESAIMDGEWDMVNQVTISHDGPGVVPPLDDGTTSVQFGLTFDQMSGLNHIARDISVELPGSLLVTLDSNPTTGYQWQEARIGDESVLSQYSRQFVEQEAGAIGAPGKDVWTFKSLERGTSTLQFTYCRPWAGGEENEWTVELNVTVN